MSTLRVNNLQIGQSGTAAQNFTLYQPTTPDGTLRLAVGNSGATTADVLTANSSGNVGIGTTSPSQKLEIVGDIQQQNANYLRGKLAAGTVTRLFGLNSANSLYIGGIDASQSEVLFVRGGTTQMTLDSSGNLGIGTSSPSYNLDVVQNVDSASGGIRVTNSNAGTSAGAVLRFGTDQGNIGFVRANSSANTGAIGGASAVVIGNGLAFPVVVATNGVARATFDSSGNLGLGVTPSAWFSNFFAIQCGTYGNSIYGWKNSYGEISVGTNHYVNSAGNTIYTQTQAATKYVQSLGTHAWYTAPSGTAGNAISFTQAMTLDASGRLGIGVTSPTRPIDVQSDSSGTGIIIRGRSSANASSLRLYALDGTTQFAKFEANDTDVPIGAVANKPLIFITNDTERVRITSAGVLDLATGAGAVGQIKFPATQVASADANTLDDYEEGTWTPTLERTGSSYVFGNNSIGYRTGKYIKVGSQVYCWFAISIQSITTQGTSYNILSGLPFTSSGTNFDRWFGGVSISDCLPAATSMYMFATVTTAYFSNQTAALQNNFVPGQIYGFVSYQTT
jgi:hypothetical protein